MPGVWISGCKKIYFFGNTRIWYGDSCQSGLGLNHNINTFIIYLQMYVILKKKNNYFNDLGNSV